MIDLKLVNSSNITRIGFDSNLNKLIVQFKTGRYYEYDAVPENVYLQLETAVSIGKFFNEFIRGKYSYRELIIDKTGDLF
jgi:hypothetical protein